MISIPLHVCSGHENKLYQQYVLMHTILCKLTSVKVHSFCNVNTDMQMHSFLGGVKELCC